MKLSVIICTHNPRPDYLNRTLNGLQQQTLPLQEWELLLVDNGSTIPVRERFDLDWHPFSRVVAEDELGLTPARLRGIKETKSELLVFVDDDAVLASDYLEQALAIENTQSQVGAWGGSIELEFESPPAEWTRVHWPRLAMRQVSAPLWSNFTGYPDTTPWGVGMCLRRVVAEEYRLRVLADPLRRALDRSGTSLVSGGDDDMARTSHSLGLATGLFPQFRLTHLIPPGRLDEDYLLRLVEGQSYSGVIIGALHAGGHEIPRISPMRRRVGRLRRLLTMRSRARRFFEARLRGQQQAVADLARLTEESEDSTCKN
jgi:glycosyltransferase involved in cell wall biosynthesis